MNFEIGKVINYDGFSGDIISKDQKYIFINNNLLDGKVENNQTVVFEPIKIHDIHIASNVQAYELYLSKKENPRLVKKNNYDIINKE